MTFDVQKSGNKDIYIPWSDGVNKKLLKITDFTGIQIWVHKFHLNLTAGEGGTVEGGGRFKYMKSTIIKAIPNDKYEFVQWSDGNTDSTRTIQMNQKNDISLHATFKLSGHYVRYYFYDNDTTVRYEQFVEDGQPATDPGLSLHSSWTHVKWKNNDGGAEFGQPIYSDTNYYGRWETNLSINFLELSSSYGSSVSGTYSNKYFPKNGILSTNIRATASHAASVNGHAILIEINIKNVSGLPLPQLITSYTTISPKTKNEPIGIEVPGNTIINNLYDRVTLTISKASTCSVSWTFDGNIVMVLD